MIWDTLLLKTSFSRNLRVVTPKTFDVCNAWDFIFIVLKIHEIAGGEHLLIDDHAFTVHSSRVNIFLVFLILIRLLLRAAELKVSARISLRFLIKKLCNSVESSKTSESVRQTTSTF
ncbi:hypothetical protein GQX74_011150 [Glossina fuscipes]|nr:hypothetical protein GQX74_011150 [Glossina fuscipes]